MSIVFGWYSFKIKTYTPEELGLENENNEHVTFEVRQKCFHLFWIPVFGLEIIYGLRKNDVLYELPYEYIQLINSKEEIKSPWYTYLLLLIGGVVLVWAVIMQMYSNYQYTQKKEREHEQLISQIDNRLNHLEVGNYMHIKNLIDYSTDDTYLKIISVDGEQIGFVSMQVTGDDNDNTYYIQKYYNAHYHELDTFTASLGDFKQMVCADYDVYHGYDDFGYPIFKGNDTKYVIEEIGDLEGAILDIRSWGGSDKINLLNFGTAIVLTKIETIEGTANWDVELPLYYPTDSVDYNQANDDAIICSECDYESVYKVKITVEDTLKTYTYIISRIDDKNYIDKSF